jgi:hypothetical protein
MLLYRLNNEVINLPYIADVYSESDNQAERDSPLDIAVRDAVKPWLSYYKL